jgi:hypothetical protein
LTENTIAASNYRGVIEVSNGDRAIVPGRAAYVDSSLIPLPTLMAEVFGGDQMFLNQASAAGIVSIVSNEHSHISIITPTVLERRK